MPKAFDLLSRWRTVAADVMWDGPSNKYWMRLVSSGYSWRVSNKNKNINYHVKYILYQLMHMFPPDPGYFIILYPLWIWNG